MSRHVKNLSLRNEVCAALVYLNQHKLSSGLSGNVSVRTQEGMLISPTGVAAIKLRAKDVVALTLTGEPELDQLKPSSEWQMHADIYRHKPEVHAVVHCHSNYATIMACAGKTIPALHYMIAVTQSDVIPLADYARFGTTELSTNTLLALETSKACLLANHGQIAVAEDLSCAMKIAQQVEELAFWYWGVLSIGQPTVLNAAQMLEVKNAFSGYGQQD